MQPLNMFCSNAECPSCGQTNKGNIIWHNKSQGRLKCKVCKKTFSQYKDTPFFGLRKTRSLLVTIVILLSHGCPLAAITAAFNLDRRTVSRLIFSAGDHCASLHGHLVEVPRNHGQVQADEIYAKVQSDKTWVAMAIAVGSRLWLGAVCGKKRSQKLIDKLCLQIRRCCQADVPLLVVTDGLKTYVKSLKRAFAIDIVRKTKGRRQKMLSASLVIAQGVKSYIKHGKRYVCHGFHYCTLALGTFEQLSNLIKITQSTPLLNTAYIERLNATFRQKVSALGRRSRHLMKVPKNLNAWIYLQGATYNFCRPHRSLGKNTSPAMTAGITKHIWSVKELLEYRIPPPLWKPKKRGPRNDKDLEILRFWRPDLI
jgi:transposase-like protein